MRVEIRRAVSLADFLWLRRLRNANRTNLTGNPRPIGLLAQLRFWLRRPAGIDLYLATVDGRRAGYLLLRRAGDVVLVTEVVDARFRNRGVARRMIAFATGLHPFLTAEILADNEASRRLHLSAGFVRIGSKDGIERYTLVR